MRASRTAETETAKIEITLTREVTDKVANLDGHMFVSGQAVYEAYDVTITHKASGKRIHVSGMPGDFAFFKTADKYTQLPAGATARVGDGYVGQAVYDICMALIAELDADLTKSDAQVALEQAETERKALAALEGAKIDAEYARKIANGWCPKCGSYCYGDCGAN